MQLFADGWLGQVQLIAGTGNRALARRPRNRAGGGSSANPWSASPIDIIYGIRHKSLFVNVKPCGYKYKWCSETTRSAGKESHVKLLVVGEKSSVSEGLHDFITRRLHFVLGRFAREIERVTVRVGDLNGPRGGTDKRCHMEVKLRGLGDVLGEASPTTLRRRWLSRPNVSGGAWGEPWSAGVTRNGGLAYRWPAPASRPRTASVPTKENRTHQPSNLRKREQKAIARLLGRTRVSGASLPQEARTTRPPARGSEYYFACLLPPPGDPL